MTLDVGAPRAGSHTGEPGRIKRAIRITLLLGMLGTGVELLLLGHTEDVWQLSPLVLLAASMGVTAWRLVDRGGASRLPFLAAMVLSLASGLVGTFLHYQANAAFELEMAPGLAGWELFAEAMTGATPALAPGAMALLGLIGLVSELGPVPNRTANR